MVGSGGVVCKVKKSERQFDMLLKFIQLHLDAPAEVELRIRGLERNALRKVLALRESASAVFWALAQRYRHVFKAGRNEHGSITLDRARESALEPLVTAPSQWPASPCAPAR